MLFWILVSIVNADVNEELLTRINRLESANEYLRGQVVSCRTTGPDSISSDLTYNKEKLSSLISEFSTSRDKVYIAEEISYYLQAISEDLKVVNTSTEQITWEEIEATLEALNEKIFRLRAGKQSENFARAYNQIQHKLDEASGNYLNSLKDNAKLLGLIETTKADLASLQTLYELSQITIQSLRADAQAAREQHQERISSISSSLLDSAKVSQDFQLENYSQVQNTENTLISELQKKNIELTLKIEQLNTDLSVFQHSEILQNSTISGLVSKT